MSYFILQNDETKGPYTLGQLKAMWNSGTVTMESLHCQEGYSEWLPLKVILGELEPTPMPPLVQPTANLPSQAARQWRFSWGILWALPAAFLTLLAFGFLASSLRNRATPPPNRATPPPASASSVQEAPKQTAAVTVGKIEVGGNGAVNWITGEVASETSVHLQQLGIRFSLFDSSGAKVGTATDSISDLQPHGVWRFKATVWEDSTKTYKLDQVWCKAGRIY